MEPSENFKERYRAAGYSEGVLAERMEAIRLLGRIAESPDIEVALAEAHDKLVTIQAAEASAAASAREGSHAQRVPAAVPSASLDNGDKVAAAMGLTLPSASRSKP